MPLLQGVGEAADPFGPFAGPVAGAEDFHADQATEMDDQPENEAGPALFTEHFEIGRMISARLVIFDRGGRIAVEYDQARAYHSAYFEMLGEQGWPGLILWLIIHFGGLIRMEILRARYRDRDGSEWISSLANALQQGHFIYLIGSLFVGIAFQPFVYMLVGMQIGLDTYAGRKAREEAAKPFGRKAKAAVTA